MTSPGCCPDHLSRFHLLNYQMRQKYKISALQSTKTSELLNEALQPAVAYELSIEAHQPTETYKSSDENNLLNALGLFN
ncbi:6619_t:CDS:2 [Acaulospora morrowiae]|uniref:6619_t:CDS:1 n=1 Tax=Acaulospora morrowiae TaxID=94023 RepID=A0A9N9ABM1_9GLOM|nr:6619_t:CDS:2 [Acaulospora morrowiae]